MKFYILMIVYLCATSMNSAYCAMDRENQTQQAEQKQQELTYSEGELREIFNHLKEHSYAELSNVTELIFRERKSFGYASPFSFNLYIDIERINNYQWPKDAVIGLFAHEMAHIVSYQRRPFLSRMLFIWNYYISDDTRRNVEHEADEIAIQKGYGAELVLTRTLAIRDYDQERVERMKDIYYRPEELEDLIMKTK